jgi:hypothetical protein
VKPDTLPPFMNLTPGQCELPSQMKRTGSAGNMIYAAVFSHPNRAFHCLGVRNCRKSSMLVVESNMIRCSCQLLQQSSEMLHICSGRSISSLSSITPISEAGCGYEIAGGQMIRPLPFEDPKMGQIEELAAVRRSITTLVM